MQGNAKQARPGSSGRALLFQAVGVSSYRRTPLAGLAGQQVCLLRRPTWIWISE